MVLGVGFKVQGQRGIRQRAMSWERQAAQDSQFWVKGAADDILVHVFFSVYFTTVTS
jgi:hypothetical protein